MMTMILLALLILASGGMALIAASPLYRTLSITIDNWADAVHGRDPELRP